MKKYSRSVGTSSSFDMLFFNGRSDCIFVWSKSIRIRIVENDDAMENIDGFELNDELKEKAKNWIRNQVSENARRYMVEIMLYPKSQSNLNI